MEYTIHEYIAKRNILLASMDVDGIIELAEEMGVNIPSDRTTIIAGMHKTRIHSISITKEKKEESLLWLIENGFSCHL